MVNPVRNTSSYCRTKISNEVNYLRLSITDRCNLRCIYCMPRCGIETVAQSELLTFEEIIRLGGVFAKLGIKKIRLTGGEPLVRKGFLYLIKSLMKIEGIEKVLLTTNGVLLPFCAASLKEAGLDRINVSLDTLNRAKFKRLNGSDSLSQVLAGIQEAKKAGFAPLRLNTVIMKGVNDDEITDFIEFALAQGAVLRFIEFMRVTPLWREDYYISVEEIKDICRRSFKLRDLEQKGSSLADYYEIEGKGMLGFIKTDENNCKFCNRLRLSSTGKLKICLYEGEGLSLKEPLRRGASDREIMGLVSVRVGAKRGTNFKNFKSAKVYMCNIGG